MRRLLSVDWDAWAGILAAVVALVLHWLHVVEESVLLMIALVLVALLFLRAMRLERAGEHLGDELSRIARDTSATRAAVRPPDAELVGPSRIRDDSAAFSRHARGEMTWFHVCLRMFQPQSLFDVLLRPAIENPRVTAIRFVLDADQRDLWRDHVAPKLEAIRGAEKVLEPIWTKIDENVSVILASDEDGRTECLLSFWGEPFMSRRAGRDVPRYVFRVHAHSELVPHLVELARRYRFAG